MSIYISQALEFIQQNQFASGGLFIGILTGLAYSIKSIPFKILNFIHSRLYIDIRIDESNSLFHIIKTYFTKNDLVKLCRFYNAHIDEDNVELSLASGHKHWFFCQRRLATIKLERVEKEHRILERFFLRIYTRRKKVALNIIKQIAISVNEDLSNIKIFKQDYESSYHIASVYPILSSTLFLPKNTFNDLVEDFKVFQASKDDYIKKGIRYKRGYLFYGPPGNGKSKTIIALCTALKKSICMLDVESSLSSMMSTISSAPANSIFIIEDVDKYLHLKGKSSRSKLAESLGLRVRSVEIEDDEEEGDIDGTESKIPKIIGNLLNLLDGPYTKSGQIIIFTTNHIECLDPALLRAGRMDVKLYFGNPNKEQCEEMVRLFFPDINSIDLNTFVEHCVSNSYCMAQVQELLVRFSSDFSKLLESIQAL